MRDATHRCVGTDEDLVALGREISRRRRALGLSQEVLAERAGLHRNYIGLVERGERNPSFKTVVDVGRALGASAADLCVGVKP